jgi:hypothetical protein
VTIADGLPPSVAALRIGWRRYFRLADLRAPAWAEFDAWLCDRLRWRIWQSWASPLRRALELTYRGLRRAEVENFSRKRFWDFRQSPPALLVRALPSSGLSLDLDHGHKGGFGADSTKTLSAVEATALGLYRG